MPDNLAGRARELWDALHERYEFLPHESATLLDACRTLTLIDRLEAVAADAEPVVLGSSRQPVANPLFAELRQQRSTFASLIHRIGLPDVFEEDEDEAARDAQARSRAARSAAHARWKRGA